MAALPLRRAGGLFPHSCFGGLGGFGGFGGFAASAASAASRLRAPRCRLSAPRLGSPTSAPIAPALPPGVWRSVGRGVGIVMEVQVQVRPHRQWTPPLTEGVRVRYARSAPRVLVCRSFRAWAFSAARAASRNCKAQPAPPKKLRAEGRGGSSGNFLPARSRVQLRSSASASANASANPSASPSRTARTTSGSKMDLRARLEAGSTQPSQYESLSRTTSSDARPRQMGASSNCALPPGATVSAGVCARV